MADITTKAQLYYPGAGNASSDFIGFSFNGVTHTQLGISRVSDGSRYNEEMLPSFQDKSAQMPGSDYTLYWESFYSTKTWSLQIAFDNMTEAQMSLFRQTFNTKNLAPLTFAERPNIHWLAKVQSPPQLKYICFDVNGSKIFKGEGTINLIAYYPFGMSNLITVPNGSSGFATNSTSAIITNNGDIPMDWCVVLAKSKAQEIEEIKVEVVNSSNVTTFLGKLVLDHAALAASGTITDSYIIINSKTNLIEGSSTTTDDTTGAFSASGKVYNQYISSGDFFQIPVSEADSVTTFYLVGTTSGARKLQYRYLYL